MDDPHIDDRLSPDKLESFRALCWARARLWQAGELRELPHAVDKLHRIATDWGLYRRYGIDFIQAEMSAAFAEVRDDL